MLATNSWEGERERETGFRVPGIGSSSKQDREVCHTLGECGVGDTVAAMEGKYHAEGQSCRMKGLRDHGPEGCSLESRTAKMKHRN